MEKIKNTFLLKIFLLLFFLSSVVSLQAFWFENQQTNADDFRLSRGFWQTKQDPFLAKENNNPNAGGFSAQVFDRWVIRVTFDKDNVPDYGFISNKQFFWQKNSSGNAYIVEGENSSAGRIPLSSMKYYLYKGSEKGNPLFSQQNFYNQAAHKQRLKRFYFYRFIGKAMGLVTIDNPLGVVDSYSKLLFAFSTPSNIVEVFGKPMPKKWIPLEEHSSKKKSTYMFYEYDPIGWVDKSGKVYLFSWFKERQRAGNFVPRKSPLSATVAKAGSEGRSPYAMNR